jgi:adhesin transport system outer membrane protein
MSGKRTVFILAAALWVLIVSSSFAIAAGESPSDESVAQPLPALSLLPPLRFEQALRSAADTHPTVALKLSEQNATEFGVEGARWQRWPGLSVSSSRGTLGNTLTEVQLEQPLWTGGRITAGINAAQARADAARAGVTEAKQAVIERTVNAYAETMRLQARIAAATDTIADYQRLTELIDRRVATGVSPKSDGVNVRAKLQQAQGELLQLTLQLRNARAELEVLVGRRFGELMPPLALRKVIPNLDESLQAAIGSAPTLGRLAAEERAAEETIAATKSSLSPSLSVRYNRTFGGGTLYPGDQVFIGVTYQPGSGLSSMSAISEAESRRAGAIHSSEAARRDLIDRVRSFWNLAESSQSETAVLNELVLSTQQVYESCLRQFPVGRRTWLEVLLARRDATQAQYAVADAIWAGFAARIKLDLVTGQLAARNYRPEYQEAE